MKNIESYVKELQKGLKECLEDIQRFYEDNIEFCKFHSKEEAIKSFKEDYKRLLDLI